MGLLKLFELGQWSEVLITKTANGYKAVYRNRAENRLREKRISKAQALAWAQADQLPEGLDELLEVGFYAHRRWRAGLEKAGEALRKGR